MADMIIAYDLGTGGSKASLFDSEGALLSTTFVPYETSYPHAGWHEQRPDAWWDAIVESTHRLLAKSEISASDIRCLAISGQSLGVIPVDKSGKLLRDATPIWSDRRAIKQVGEFFSKADERQWYLTTGNGFPSVCYSVFKLMWYRENEPEMFSKVYKFLGSKDYINLKLTGKFLTDFSYASGSGVYDLLGWKYSPAHIIASGLPPEVFPQIVPSTEIIGTLNADAATQLGLQRSLMVACGGVDNSCMALGARNTEDGRVYTSLGSSSWIAVSSRTPVLDVEAHPYVFAHVVPELFTSAVSIFSGGNSFRWVKDMLLGADFKSTRDVYEILTELAANSPVGANRILFNPSLAGGGMQEPSPNIRGGFSGIDLRHTRADLVRSAMEGIALNLGAVLEVLRKFVPLSNEMLMVGGGSKSKLWRQIFADVYRMECVKTNVDQEAATLGAAAVAAVGAGIWKDFRNVDSAHRVESVERPIQENVDVYRKLMPAFECMRRNEAALGDLLTKISF
jgi:xylulokinase